MSVGIIDSILGRRGSGGDVSSNVLTRRERVEDILSRRMVKEIMACGVALSFLAAPFAAEAATIRLAVASNFYGVAPIGSGTSIIYDLIQDFQALYPGNTVTVIANGATQTLKNQITTGNTSAVDLFLAADYTTPQDLAANYSTMVSGQVFPYAQGILAVLSADPSYDLSCVGSGTCGYTTAAGYPSVAIASPSLAPYGEAARELLWNQFGIDYTTVATIHTYTNITAAYNAVANGTDAVGFVALSAICQLGSYPSNPDHTAHAYSPVVAGNSSMQYYYKPLVQGAVTITIGTSRGTAEETLLNNFKAFLQNFTIQTSSSTSDSPMVTRLKQYCYSPPQQ